MGCGSGSVPKSSAKMNTDIAAQKALDRLAKAGFEQLTDLDKILAAVWTFEAGVANRGFARYFSCSAGDMAFHVPSALRAIGAVGTAEIAAKANGVFGASGPPKDKKKRAAIVRSFDDDSRKMLQALETLFYESEENVDDLLEVYLNRKP